MNERARVLAERHGALRARIADQRARLARQVAPVEEAFQVVDRGVAGVTWLKHHPEAVGIAALCLVLLKPKRAWAWAKRGWLAWRGWQGVKKMLERAA